MNTLELSNVEIRSEDKQYATEVGRDIAYVEAVIEPVIQRLAILKPLWRFVSYGVTYGANNKLKVVGFKVFEHGEELGVIERFYAGREHVIHIDNARIGRERVRRGGYKTKDADKAILKAKKMFYRRNPNELLEDAMRQADRIIEIQKRSRNNELYKNDNVVRQTATEFIMGEGFPLFLAHIKEWHEIDRNRVLLARSNAERLRLEMLSIQKIKDHFANRTAAVVVRDGGKYLVKVGDNVQLYDDNSLPEIMKGRLGMLKLVDAEYFIEDVGCRVNDEVFVVLMDEET